MKIDTMKDQLADIRKAVTEILELLKDDGFYTESKNILEKAKEELFSTNIPWMLDSAVLRLGRFDFKCHILQPSFEARKRIFKLNIDVAEGKNIIFDVLACVTEGYSGADI